MASGDKHALSAGATNTGTADDGNILVSNGDDTSKFITPNDAGIVPYTSSAASTPTLSDYTTTGVYAVAMTSTTDFPSNLPSSADYCILTVHEYSTTHGTQVLRSADYDSSTTQIYEYYRAWESGSFTDWYQVPMFNESQSPSAGNMLVSTGVGGNFEVVPRLRYSKIYRTGNSSISSGTNYTVAVGGGYINTDTDYFSYDGDQINILQDGYYRITCNLSYYGASDLLIVRVSTSTTGWSSNVLLGQSVNTGSNDTGNISMTGIHSLSSGTALYVHIYCEDQFYMSYVNGRGDTSLIAEWLGNN